MEQYILNFTYNILSDIYSDILSEILSDIYSDILSDINSDILSGASCSGLAGNTLILSSGPAGNTATLRLQLGSGGEHSDPELTVRAGGEHSDPELAVRVRQGTLRFCACSWGFAGKHSDPELAVRVRQGTLRSCACCSACACYSGPAGNTLILSLLFGSGREHCDFALGVEFRVGTLWSWACCSGPAGNTAILRLQLRFGGEHSDPELAVWVRQGTLRSSACSWGPEGNTLMLSLLFGPAGNTLILSCCSGPAGNTAILRLLFGLSLVVRVRRGTLWSWACCSGPAGNTAILRLGLSSVWEHSDPELAVRARQGAAEEGGRRKEEEDEAKRRRRRRSRADLTWQVGKKCSFVGGKSVPQSADWAVYFGGSGLNLTWRSRDAFLSLGPRESRASGCWDTFEFQVQCLSGTATVPGKRLPVIFPEVPSTAVTSPFPTLEVWGSKTAVLRMGGAFLLSVSWWILAIGFFVVKMMGKDGKHMQTHANTTYPTRNCQLLGGDQ